MANFYESKPMQWVKKAGEKVVGNKGIQAISSGMMMVMGVILLGAVFQLLAVILQTIGIIDQSSGIYSALMVPYKVSMGFISLNTITRNRRSISIRRILLAKQKRSKLFINESNHKQRRRCTYRWKIWTFRKSINGNNKTIHD